MTGVKLVNKLGPASLKLKTRTSGREGYTFRDNCNSVSTTTAIPNAGVNEMSLDTAIDDPLTRRRNHGRLVFGCIKADF